jgi:WhiB family transcriptional regulator, redox-sensing transcriptional regulator
MSWRQQALCAVLPSDTKRYFFSDDPSEILESQVVCTSCPVLEECLRYALETSQTEGVWGMHTAQDRSNLKRFMTRRPLEAQRYWDMSMDKVRRRITQR